MEGSPSIFSPFSVSGRLRPAADEAFDARVDLPVPGGPRHLAARGPFQNAAVPPRDGFAWYVNDFMLSHPAPWRIPAETLEIPADAPEPAPGAAALPPVRWDAPGRAAYQNVFESVMRWIDSRALLKLVPVSVQTGEFERPPDAAALRATLHPRRAAGMGHTLAWSGDGGGAGFAAITPEVLFELEGTRLTTMALAGTADAEHENDLRHRPKLTREHEIVVDELHRRLAPLGRVEITGREVVTFGTVRHLRTRLCVNLPAPPRGEELNELVRLLHPTPALGVSPRSPETLELLRSCRERCAVPEHFGAPFGIAWPGGAAFFVAIRGIFWNNTRLCVPAGGGLVTGSEFETEWEEQELKRAWVRHAFGLNEP